MWLHEEHMNEVHCCQGVSLKELKVIFVHCILWKYQTLLEVFTHCSEVELKQSNLSTKFMEFTGCVSSA